MSSNYKSLDHFKLTGHVSTNFACSMSKDDRISIISDIGLYIISLKPNLDSAFSKFSCRKYFIKPSDYAVCDKVDIDINQFFHELPKDMFYESVARSELSQNLTNTAPLEPSIISAEWSDLCMVNGADCMLGVLTNLYSLEIYIKYFDESNVLHYKPVLNLTNEILEHRRADFVYSKRLPPVQKMNELKKRVEYISPTVFCWGHTFTLDKQPCTVIFLGHFNGAISVFRIFGMDWNDSGAKCDFLGRYDTKLSRISAMYWRWTQDYGGGLCIGDAEGRISVLQITNLDKPECFVPNEVEFFKDKDRQVDKLTVMTFGDYTILVAAKQSYLLLYGMDQNGRVFDFTAHNVEHFYITGLIHNENILKALTFTGVFKELNLSVHFNKISIEEKILPIKVDFTGLRTHGLLQSQQKVFIVIVTCPYTLKKCSKNKQLVNVDILHDSKLEPLKILLDVKSGSLRYYWDCFETLRLICLKEQRFPWLGIDPQMDYDVLSLVQLKTLRLIAKISETVFKVVKTVVNYDIKPYILIHYLVEIKLICRRLNELFHDKNSGRMLTDFEMRSIDLQVFFLKEMVIGGILAKAKVGLNFIEEITHVLGIANEIEFPDMIQCCFCGEKLIGPMCIPPHNDARCCFTMMPIPLAPAYQCALCKALSNYEINLELPVMCPYCDYPMEKICMDEGIQKVAEDFKRDLNEKTVKSKCHEDCLVDTGDAICDLEINLEDDDTAFVFISDGDSESEDDKLREVYLKVAKMNVGDDSGAVNETNSGRIKVVCDVE